MEQSTNSNVKLVPSTVIVEIGATQTGTAADTRLIEAPKYTAQNITQYVLVESASESSWAEDYSSLMQHSETMRELQEQSV